jgi:Bacterial Ig domain
VYFIKLWLKKVVYFVNTISSYFKIIFLIIGSGLIVLLFQNCGSGFEVHKEVIASVVATAAPGPIAPATSVPTIVAPLGIYGVGMNVPGKIVLNAVDADTPVTSLTYVIRNPPQSGKLLLDEAEITLNRGVAYTPNKDFIGTDSFTLSVKDPQGNMGPDQKFDVIVEQKGIGQMLGTWTKPTCIPTTAPVTGTYTSTLDTFTLVQTVYSNDCLTPIFENRMTGTHTAGLENIPTFGGTLGFEYNITNYRTFITPLSAVAAQTLNAQVYCGYTGWVAGQAKDLAAGCNGVWAGSNVFMYRRVEYPANQPARLYYSSSTAPGNGNTPATRSTGLQLSFYFTK